MRDKKVSFSIDLNGKNMLIAYLLWWFLGWAGGHRFYLGKVKTAMLQLFLFISAIVLYFVIIGYLFIFIWFIWWILDAYFIFKIVQEENIKQGVINSAISVSKSGSLADELDQLEKLHALYEKGALTKQQYEERKSTLL